MNHTTHPTPSQYATAFAFYADRIGGYLDRLRAEYQMNPCALAAVREDLRGVVAVSRERYEMFAASPNWRGDMLPAVMATRLFVHRVDAQGNVTREQVDNRAYVAAKGFYREIIDCEHGYRDYTLFGKMNHQETKLVLRSDSAESESPADILFSTLLQEVA